MKNHRVTTKDIPWLRDLEQDFKGNWEPDSKGGEPNHMPEPTGDARIYTQTNEV